MVRRRLIICLCLLTVFTVWGAAPAAAPPPLPTPTGFGVAAGNGYRIHALSFDGGPSGSPDGLLLFVQRRTSGVLYAFEGGVEVTESSISANLGELGSIDLRFVPTGSPKSERSSCNPKRYQFDSGAFEGRIDFEGEEGFTAVHAAGARGEMRLALNLVCGAATGGEGVGGRSPGARLTVRRRLPAGSIRFEATKNSPTRPARFRAEIVEQRANLNVLRTVTAEAGAGAGAFDFDVPGQTGRVRPPAPFSGAATFARTGTGRGRLRGDLQVDFPGHSNVPIAPSRGGLQRYVQNPGRPFRLAARPNLSQWLSTRPSPTASATFSLPGPN